MTRSDYLLQRLLRNELTRDELDEVLEHLDRDDRRADYADALEPYFRQLLAEAASEAPAEAPRWLVRRNWGRYGRWAAAVAFVVGAGWVVRQGGPGSGVRTPARTRSEASSLLAEAAAPRGQRRPVQLADGSRVELNAGSRLRYPSAMDGTTRAVRLSGEAFFDVQRDPERPFVLTTEALQVRVLGTSFNVRAYPDDPETVVTVRTGRVRVTVGEGPEGTVDLTPDQQLILDRRTRTYRLETVRAEEVRSWTDGTLRFQNTSLRDVVRTVERWYDVDIVVEDSTLYTSSFSGGHQNESLTAVLESITYAIDARYERTGRTVRLRRARPGY